MSKALIMCAMSNPKTPNHHGHHARRTGEEVTHHWLTNERKLMAFEMLDVKHFDHVRHVKSQYTQPPIHPATMNASPQSQ
jgi:hypothetical protein